MRIELTSIIVDDQRAALAFYTNVLGFVKHRDIPLGTDAWLTVVAPDSPDGPELLLEPSGHPAVQPPTEFGEVTTAALDDGCGNLIQLVSPTER